MPTTGASSPIETASVDVLLFTEDTNRELVSLSRPYQAPLADGASASRPIY
jgi:hypothetical protein